MSAMLMSRWVFSMTFAASAIERVLLVAGVDPLRRITELEVGARETRDAREDRPAHVLRDAGIDGRLVDDDVALLERFADGLGRTHHRGEVGDVVAVDRRRDGDDEERRVRKLRRIGRHLELALLEDVLRDLVVPVVAARELRHLARVDVEADGSRELRRERERDRQPNVSEPYDRDPLHFNGFYHVSTGSLERFTAACVFTNLTARESRAGRHGGGARPRRFRQGLRAP
jgi:hypothetical protein